MKHSDGASPDGRHVHNYITTGLQPDKISFLQLESSSQLHEEYYRLEIFKL